MKKKKASEISAALNLKPHPEGGFFTETFRDSSTVLPKSHLPSHYKVDRPVSSAIYFLLPSGSVSRFHRIPCAETWHFYSGDPLTVIELNEHGDVKLTVLGPDIAAGQCPQYTVPGNVWFGSFPTNDVESFSLGSSESAGGGGGALVLAPGKDPEEHYSLVGCTCAPAFQFEDFELATTAALAAVAPQALCFIKYLVRDG